MFAFCNLNFKAKNYNYLNTKKEKEKKADNYNNKSCKKIIYTWTGLLL